MKGVILAGGTGSRLLPLTRVTNKHLLPVGRLPMILHGVNRLVTAGVTDILVITGTEHMGAMVSLLGSGKEFGCTFTFRVQDQPDGIAGALKLAENFVGNDAFAVMLGDNIFEENLEPHFQKWLASRTDCGLFLKRVKDPRRFGVPKFSEQGDIVDILEKPLVPPSEYCVTGLYCYMPVVFDVMRDIKKSERGEYEITDVNKAFIVRNSVSHSELHGEWTDAGTMSSYFKANRIMTETE